MESKRTHIVGFDLGDGESCIAYAMSDSLSKPQMFKFRQGGYVMPTAIAKYMDGLARHIVVGEDAFWKKNKIDLAINFKWNPETEPEQWQSLQDELLLFADILLTEFQGKHPEAIGNTNLYIGCPSGWSEKARMIYEELFQRLKVFSSAIVRVVPESRSALIQARDDQLLPPELINKKVLLIDIGSSTTDVTIVEGIEAKEVSVGHDLGLRLVDERLQNMVTSRSGGQIVKDLIDQNTVDHQLLLYTCRLAKEAAFGRNINPVLLFQNRDWLRDVWEFLMSLELKSCLHTPAFWDGETWLQKYRNLLSTLRQSELVGEPDVLIVSGGGSNIPLLREEAEQYFPNAHPIRAAEPSYTVAYGLASYGRWRMRVELFRTEAKEFIDGSSLSLKLSQNFSQFLGSLARIYLETDTEVVWTPIARQWKEGTLDLKNKNGMTEYARILYLNWIKQNGDRMFAEPLAMLNMEVNQVMSEGIRSIGGRCGLPLDDFKIQVPLSLFGLFEPRSPWMLLLSHVSDGFQDIHFVALDKIPISARKIIPNWFIDASLKFDGVAKKLMGSVAGTDTALQLLFGAKYQELMAEFVRKAANAEIERNLAEIDRLLLVQSARQ